jgi:mRNA-degrading endonuclease toxin of MazEF toxin-antitoxin module
MTLHAGDIVEVDFGSPIGSEPGFVHPVLVVSAEAYLSGEPRTFHVVPCTSNTERSLLTEVPLSAAQLEVASVAQCHLLSVISRVRLTGRTFGRVSAADLDAVRSVLADLLDTD